MNTTIIITETDARRLRPLVQNSKPGSGADADSINRLRIELDRAKIVPDDQLPEDVIAMNSTVELEDLTDGEILTFTLVYPEKADAAAGKISVLAPLGTAMLGYRVGDEIEWPVPAGTVRVRVRKLLERETSSAVAQGIL